MSMRAAVACLTLLLASLAAAPARAQDESVTLEARVISGERGRAWTDRRSADGLAAGDAVLFRPRTGTPFQGKVTELEERRARVDLVDATIQPADGTRAELRLPRARLEKRAQATTPPRILPAPGRQQ